MHFKIILFLSLYFSLSVSAQVNSRKVSKAMDAGKQTYRSESEFSKYGCTFSESYYFEVDAYCLEIRNAGKADKEASALEKSDDYFWVGTDKKNGRYRVFFVSTSQKEAAMRAKIQADVAALASYCARSKRGIRTGKMVDLLLEEYRGYEDVVEQALFRSNRFTEESYLEFFPDGRYVSEVKKSFFRRVKSEFLKNRMDRVRWVDSPSEFVNAYPEFKTQMLNWIYGKTSDGRKSQRKFELCAEYLKIDAAGESTHFPFFGEYYLKNATEYTDLRGMAFIAKKCPALAADIDDMAFRFVDFSAVIEGKPDYYDHYISIFPQGKHHAAASQQKEKVRQGIQSTYAVSEPEASSVQPGEGYEVLRGKERNIIVRGISTNEILVKDGGGLTPTVCTDSYKVIYRTSLGHHIVKEDPYSDALSLSSGYFPIYVTIEFQDQDCDGPVEYFEVVLQEYHGWEIDLSNRR